MGTCDTNTGTVGRSDGLLHDDGVTRDLGDLRTGASTWGGDGATNDLGELRIGASTDGGDGATNDLGELRAGASAGGGDGATTDLDELRTDASVEDGAAIFADSLLHKVGDLQAFSSASSIPLYTSSDSLLSVLNIGDPSKVI